MGVAYRELPVEWYSSFPYFPTLATASDQLIRSMRIAILSLDAMNWVCKQDARNTDNFRRVNSLGK